MKKYLFIFMIINIFFLTNVYAAQYELGSFYGFQTTGVPQSSFTKTCVSNSMCSHSVEISPTFKPVCNTDSCYIRFAFTATFKTNNINMNADLQNISTFAQIYSNNRYNPCEIDSGKLTCMVPNNKSISYIEFKWFDFFTTTSNGSLTYSAGIWFEPYEIEVFDLPANQTEQNQIINNTDTSSNSTDFNNTVNSATLPNNSHGFDILGSLQDLINGINVSGSCRRISVPIPFVNKTLTLPCMTTDVYSVHFPEIVVIWQLIVRGLGYYYILVNILKLIKETIDPFNFKLEVLDL